MSDLLTFYGQLLVTATHSPWSIHNYYCCLNPPLAFEKFPWLVRRDEMILILYKTFLMTAVLL